MERKVRELLKISTDHYCISAYLINAFRTNPKNKIKFSEVPISGNVAEAKRQNYRFKSYSSGSTHKKKARNKKF